MFWRVSAWTHPSSASFVCIEHSIPFIEVVLTDAIGPRSRGTLTIPASWPWQDLIATDPVTPANNRSSLIRVYAAGVDNTGNPDSEWLCDRYQRQINDDGEEVVKITLTHWREAGLDAARLRWYDWTAGAMRTRQPDWQYGGENQLDNGGLEDNPTDIANPGFEDGTRDPWRPGAVEGVSADASIVTTPVDTGTYALGVTPLLPEGGASLDINVFSPTAWTWTQHQKTITARVWGASGVTYQIGATGPGDMVPQGGATMDPHDLANGGFEVHKSFVGTGAYATVTLQFLAGLGQKSTQLSVREFETVLNGSDFFIDLVTTSGYGTGTDPWQPTDAAQVDIFEVDTIHPDTGAYALHITADFAHGVYRRQSGTKPGVTYHTSIRLGWASASTLWLFEVRDIRGGVIAQTSATIGTGAYTTLSLTWVAPDFLPGSNGEVDIRVINYAFVDDLTVFIDNAAQAEGLPAATWGQISKDALEDATIDHPSVPRLVYVNQGAFTAAVDSAAVAWPREESVTLRRGWSYGRHLFGGLGFDLGYEYDLTPNGATAAWDLEVWATANHGATLTTTAFLIGMGIAGGAVAGRIPKATRVLLEGADGIITEVADAAQEAIFGIVEDFLGEPDITDLTSLAGRGNAQLAEELANTLAITAELDDSAPIPYQEFALGDTVPFLAAGYAARHNRRVTEITLSAKTSDGETIWTPSITASKLFQGDHALKEAVYRMLTAHDRMPDLPERPPEAAAVADPGVAGMVPTISFASLTSTPNERAMADVTCDGVTDPATIEAALAAYAGADIEIVFFSGTYYLTVPVDLSTLGHVTVRGIGYPLFSLTGGAFLTKEGVDRQTYRGLSFTGGASGAVILNNGFQVTVEDCVFDTITAQAIIGPHGGFADEEHWVFVADCIFADITLAGGGGASPRGLIWMDNQGDFYFGAVTGNRFEDVAGGKLVNVGSGTSLRIMVYGNHIQSCDLSSPEATYFHNWVDAVWTPGDHTGLSVAGSDSTAIHNNVAAEISAVAEKTSPIDADLILIEDSAAANAKKRVQIGNLPERMMIGGFGAENLAASLTAAQLYRQIQSVQSQLPVVVSYAGWLVGVTIASTEARTAGTATFEVYINGAASGLSAVLDVTNTQFDIGIQALGVDALAAGDRVDVRVTTSADWTPVTADVEAVVVVA